MARYNQWMPLDIGDYLSDTAHLTATQHGCYLLLIMHYWRNEGLPHRQDQILVITKAFTEEIKEDTFYILNTYFKEGINKRIDKDLSEAKRKYQVRVDAQKQSVDKRKKNGNANCKASGSAVACASTSLSSSKRIYSKKEITTMFNKFWNLWGKGAKKADARTWFEKKGAFKDADFFKMLGDKIIVYQKWRVVTEAAGQFVPALSSFVVWLNGSRWEDELADPETPAEDGLASLWDTVIAEVRTTGRQGEPFIDRFALAAIDKLAGGWMPFCGKTEREHQFIKPQFLSLYKELKAKG